MGLIHELNGKLRKGNYIFLSNTDIMFKFILAEGEYRSALDVAKLFFGADTSLGEAQFSETDLDAGSNIMNLLVLARLSSLLHRMHRYEEIEPYMAEFYFLYVKLAPTETR